MKKRDYKRLTEKFDQVLNSFDDAFIGDWLDSYRQERKINQAQTLIEGKTIEYVIESDVLHTNILIEVTNESSFANPFCNDIFPDSLDAENKPNYATAA